MIDIHCHILHGVDDGAKDLEEAVEMAKIAYADGIRHIVATPHFNDSLLISKDIILSKIEQLHAELDRFRIRLTIHPGHEVRMDSPAFIEEQIKAGAFHYLGGRSGFVLLEQRWSDYEPASIDIYRRLLDQGIRPIVPHPERHFFFRERPELVEELVEAGAWTQVTVDSLNGTNGEEAQRFAEWLADRNLIHTLATDAHNLRRKPNLSEGYSILESRIHKERADEIMARTAGILG